MKAMVRLTYDKKKPDPIYYAQTGIRVGKKVTSKTVERIGKHSELLKVTDDPLTYAKNRVRELDEAYKQNRDVELQLTVDFSEKVLAVTGQKVSQSTLNNIGYFYLQFIIGKLGLKDYCSTLEESGKMQHPIYDIMRYLIVSRIMQPESKLATFRHRGEYYDAPNIQYHQIMRFLDYSTAITPVLALEESNLSTN